MRVKHWAGYGCVEAKKVKSYTTHTNILVRGNHERGLEPRYFDKRDWQRWLGKRFHVGDFDRVEAQTAYDDGTEIMMVTFYKED